MTMEILKVQDLCKTYGKGEAKVEALKKVSLSLDKGEFAAVVGESGSGKSTLLNCIGALDTPTSGHILVDGQDLFSMKEEQRTIFRRRNIGFIFQSFQLVSELNVEQNIIFPLHIKETQDARYGLSQNRSPRRPGHPHLKYNNKQQIQHHIHKSSHHHRIQRSPAIPQRP